MDHATFEVRRRTHWYTYIGDFMNTLKAFMGTNYQGLPFAFAQSGLAFGLAGVFFIATLTDHCCQILVRCKSYVIEKTIKHELEKEKITESDVESLRERLEFAVGYGDVAKQVFGAWCFHVTQAAVCFTQFLVCVMYFVFISNTVSQIFPMKQVESCDQIGNLSAIRRELTFRLRTEHGGIGIPMLNIPNLSLNLSARYRRSAATCNSSNETTPHLVKNLQRHTDLNVSLMLLGEKPKLVKSRQISGEEADFDEMWSLLNKNGTGVCNVTTEPTAPDLRLVVLFPLPIFILTSLVRRVRYLAPMSSVATVAMLAGAISVLAFLIKGFHTGPFEWYKVNTMPLFLCQLIAAYEGIGCILPVQSSMVGCRHLFPAYLHANIYLIFVFLCLFGSLGYLRYGDLVQQIIVLEIPQHTTLSILIDITLVISVLFTYPLQCYPMIEIMETAILLPNTMSCQCCRKNSIEDAELSDESPKDELVRAESIDFSVSAVTTTVVPSTVPAWKRNVIRVGITLVTAGLAVLLRNYFVYISSISGGLGSSFLAFILPCMIDIRLRYKEMSRLIIIKNITIIVFTIIISILGLIIAVMQIVKGLSA